MVSLTFDFDTEFGALRLNCANLKAFLKKVFRKSWISWGKTYILSQPHTHKHIKAKAWISFAFLTKVSYASANSFHPLIQRT